MTRWLAWITAGVILVATPAQGHAFGARYDLPMPLGFYLAAAAAAVAASFLGAVLFLRGAEERRFVLELHFPIWAGRTASALLSFAGLFVLGTVLGASFWGPQNAVRNFATVGIWVIWWVGFLLFSALVICLWPQVDPFRRVARSVAQALRRPWAHDTTGLPTSAGLIAPMGLLAFAWVELVSDWSESPQALGTLIVIYLAVLVAGGCAFGDEWFRVADPLNRVFTTLGRVAPLQVVNGKTLRLRPPGDGLLEGTEPPRGEVALICILIGLVLFDGLSETPIWAAILDAVSESQRLRPVLLWLRDQGVDLLKVIRTVGLLATAIGFYGAFWIVILLMRTLAGRERGNGQLAPAFVGSLLPIAVAYHLSHYVSYLLIAGQLILPAASDPFGRGWDIFGARNRPIDIGVIGAQKIWWIAFIALIVGHALSVLIAHRRALQIFQDTRRAALSQIPMTFAMIGLTVLSLWILSQPITE